MKIISIGLVLLLTGCATPTQQTSTHPPVYMTYMRGIFYVRRKEVAVFKT